MSRLISFEQFKLAAAFGTNSFPSIRAHSAALAVCVHRDTVIRFNLYDELAKTRSGQFWIRRGDLYLDYNLRSPQWTTNGEKPLFAAATGIPELVMGTAGDAEVTSLYTQGPVQSVAWLGESRNLIVGSGGYGLPAFPQAFIGLIDTRNPEAAPYRLLPLLGCSVDAIATHGGEDEEITAYCSSATQEHGHICILDSDSLTPLRYRELPLAMVRKIERVGDLAILADGDCVLAADSAANKTPWKWDLPRMYPAFAVESPVRGPRRTGVLLSDGRLVRTGDGELIEQWPALPGCRDLCALPGGSGFLGIAADGTLARWTVGAA